MNVAFVARNPIFHEVNQINMLFGAFLPATANPGEISRALDLPSDCTDLFNSGHWRMVERGLTGACPEALAISPTRLLLTLLTEPKAQATLFARGPMLSSGWRTRYPGEVALGNFTSVPAGLFGVAASIGTIASKLGFAGHAIFLLGAADEWLDCRLLVVAPGRTWRGY